MAVCVIARARTGNVIKRAWTEFYLYAWRTSRRKIRARCVHWWEGLSESAHNTHIWSASSLAEQTTHCKQQTQVPPLCLNSTCAVKIKHSSLWNSLSAPAAAARPRPNCCASLTIMHMHNAVHLLKLRHYTPTHSYKSDVIAESILTRLLRLNLRTGWKSGRIFTRTVFKWNGTVF